jgi:topoisomerase-4 subunit B
VEGTQALAAKRKSSARRGSNGRGVYDESAIQTLDALEHIRLRTGMYIGRIGDGSHPADGIYVMLKEVIDNSVDEFIMGAGRRIEITREGDAISVRDQGRGIPLGKVVECVSQINTGGKYNDDVFQFSVGLNGVGTKAVNALSSEFEVTSWRDGQFRRARFEQGRLKSDKQGRDASASDGTFVRFLPDREIFERYQWQDEFIEHRLEYYAFLNTGLTLAYNGKLFRSQEGLADLLRRELGAEEPLYELAHCRAGRLEFAFTHTQVYGETCFSFVNGQYTNDGGTHQAAFREGLLKAVGEFAQKSFAPEDVRDGIVAAVAVKIQDPVFESQTKNKLGSTDVKPWILKEVKDQVLTWLRRSPEAAAALIEKVETNERIRRELASIKKEARERAKKVAIRIPKLIDCKVHYDDDKHPRRDETMIFICEGDSAGGAMIQARDVETQAIFTLKGKPLNTHGLKRDVVYKNEELYNAMRALGIEEGIDGLRYGKVVLATDADVDGMHIRNLLITFFLRYFEDLVHHQHLYILETPLFRVRNKKLTRYCYSEAEKAAALAELQGAEITRFKGLGEISPQEFGQFIGQSMRLVSVSPGSLAEVGQCLEFFMGKNTPERRHFIMENLIREVL